MQTPDESRDRPAPLGDDVLESVAGGGGVPPPPPPYTMDSANDPNAVPVDNAYKYGSAGHRFNLGQ